MRRRPLPRHRRWPSWLASSCILEAMHIICKDCAKRFLLRIALPSWAPARGCPQPFWLSVLSCISKRSPGPLGSGVSSGSPRDSRVGSWRVSLTLFLASPKPQRDPRGDPPTPHETLRKTLEETPGPKGPRDNLEIRIETEG